MGRLRQAVAERADTAYRAYTERHTSGDSVDLGTPLRGTVATVLAKAAELGKDTDTGSGQDGDH